MGESTSQIERDIMAERNELGRNLQLLENKARSLADWRTYFRNHPFAMMGIALGGGVLLGALTKNFAVSEASEYDDDQLIEPDDSHYAAPSPFASSAARAKRQFGDTWDHIADALLAVASAKAIEFVGQKVPGFREQFASKHPEHRGFSSGRNV
jgi:hypothetical protein